MGGVYGKMCSMLYKNKEVRILMQGLDAAGKTTLLYRLKLGEVVTTIPTIGFNVETVEYKNVNFTAWDIGGRDKIRPLFRHYYPNTDAIIFVVDSTDRERLPEVKEEMTRILIEDELKDTCVLVLANKQDLPNSMNTLEITEHLDLHKLRHNWYIIGASAIHGTGVYEGLDWLVGKLGQKQAMNNVQTSPENKNTSTYLSKTWTAVIGMLKRKGLQV